VHRTWRTRAANKNAAAVTANVKARLCPTTRTTGTIFAPLSFIPPSVRLAERHEKEGVMSALLKWAAVFFVISLIAALFGFGGIAEGAADAARVLFFLFLAICAVLIVLGLTVFKTVSG
jgi:uncharacterized membrane protein YtjA (UPF0391 family)